MMRFVIGAPDQVLLRFRHEINVSISHCGLQFFPPCLREGHSKSIGDLGPIGPGPEILTTPSRRGARMKPSLTFWYEFASAYSWLAVERIEALTAQAGIHVVWRPFLLGPIFAGQGWTNSPFNLFPAKGRNMWRDMERHCASMGLPPMVRPNPFPQNSLLVARVATALPMAVR